MNSASDMMAAQAELARASDYLRAGKLPEAEAVCRGIVERLPRHAGATHLLGLIRKDSGDLAGGEQLLTRSIDLDPLNADFRANRAHLLRRLGRVQEAERGYRDAVAIDPRNRGARFGLARTLSDLGQFAAAEAECRTLIAGQKADAQAWTALAMTLRAQGRLAEAEAAYRHATTANSEYAIAHNNLGALYVEMERAEEALESLNRAQSLGAKGFETAFNRGRALIQLCRLDEAEHEFAQAAALQPLHVEAQLNLAKLRFMRGDPGFARDIAAVAAASRDDRTAQLLLGVVLWRSGDLAGAESLYRDLLARKGPDPDVRAALAHVLQEAGRLKEAEVEASEAAIARPEDSATVSCLVAILLSRNRPQEALPFIRAQRAKYPEDQGWIAHEATAARLLGSPRYRELYEYPRLVRTYDVQAPAGWSSMAELNAALLEALNKRHPFAQHPFDQSLRNGSQTTRNLVTDPDPAIQALLKAFQAPIEDYRRSLGRHPGHPLSARNHGTSRFAGAWSVQLHREGFHVNHVHPQGWISSAYYVAVPNEVQDATLMSGWIKFGEPRFPVPGATPELFVQPRPGRLVLFPSYMWHGTNPIHGKETRTAVAFDAVPSRKE